MKLLTILLLSTVLMTGCGSFKLPKPEIVVAERVEYVVKIPPVESMQLPEEVKPIDIDTAKQSTVAQWIIDNEDRMIKLENKIKSIASFFKAEQDKLATKAAEENKKSQDEAIERQANSASEAIKKPIVK